MSSKLKRKSKPLEPYGYSKKELAYIENLSKQNRKADNLIEESYLNIKLIAYQILHDKFGFGKKRIDRVESTIDTYLKGAAVDSMTEDELEFLLKEKSNIDVRYEANLIPFREQFYLLTKKVKPADMQKQGKLLNASIINFFALLGVCLKTQFKFSARQIKEVYEHIRSYINTLSRYKEFLLKIEHIAESVALECGFVDERFARKEGGEDGTINI